MPKLIAMKFSVGAAKEYYKNHPNWNYLDSLDSAKLAVAAINDIRDYPIQQTSVDCEYDDGTMTKMDLFTGNISNFKKIPHPQSPTTYIWKEVK